MLSHIVPHGCCSVSNLVTIVSINIYQQFSYNFIIIPLNSKSQDIISQIPNCNEILPKTKNICKKNHANLLKSPTFP